MTQRTELLLLEIDGLNLLRRVYGANPAPDSDAKAEGAIKNALSSVRRALREHRPTHALCVFDTPGPNWRHDLYPEYRAKRKPMPEPLRQVLPDFVEMLNSINLLSNAQTGVEADDVMSAGADHWSLATQGAPCVILTTDKDLVYMLTRPGVRVRNHFDDLWHDEAWLLKKWGIAPHQVLDFLALMGDDTDGIPGVSKVGEVTASKLLQEHGDLEGVLAAAPNIKGALGKRLVEQAGMARLSRQLTELRTDVSLVQWSLEDIKLP